MDTKSPVFKIYGLLLKSNRVKVIKHTKERYCLESQSIFHDKVISIPFVITSDEIVQLTADVKIKRGKNNDEDYSLFGFYTGI